MKPINVIAKKVKNGFLIPMSPDLEKIRESEIYVSIIGNKDGSGMKKNVSVKAAVSGKKKNPADDKSYKELAAEAAVERYEKKSKNQVPSMLTEEQVQAFAKKYNVENMHTIDDILLTMKTKRR